MPKALFAKIAHFYGKGKNLRADLPRGRRQRFSRALINIRNIMREILTKDRNKRKEYGR